MTTNDLIEELGVEIDLIETIIKELISLKNDLTEREPTVREKTAVAAFMAQFYGGIENILKRISRFYKIPLPSGDNWHVELFKRFCEPPYQSLPGLFNKQLASNMAPFRKFRHVVYHGYGFQLDWDRIKDGLRNIEDLFHQFKVRLNDYLQLL